MSSSPLQAQGQPLYVQIQEDLIARIRSGEFKVGDMIPSQKMLAAAYGVSDITVRKALDLLVNEGYLYRIQGKGTFVAERKINRVLNLMSFTEEMSSRGLEVESRVMELKVITDRRVARELKILPTKEIVKITRLRLVDGKPYALQTSYIPAAIASLEHMEKMREMSSLYQVLKEIGVQPSKAHEIYRADVLTDHRLCRLLQAQHGEPILAVERYTYTKDEILFEYVQSILKGNLYTIEVVLDR